jgi:hypothetical protein
MVATKQIAIWRASVASSKPFEQFVVVLPEAIGHPTIGGFREG